MGSTEILYDYIEKYLDGSLDSTELEVFEKKIKTDQELQNEVNLHRDLASLLADSPEDAFRDNLSKLSSRMKDPSAGFDWKYLLILLPVVLFASWWFVGYESDAITPSVEIPEEILPPPIQQKNIEVTEPDLEGMSPEEIRAIEKEAAEPIKEVVPETESSTSGKIATQDFDSKPKSEPSRTLIASADFDPNPSLEFLIENNRRGGEIEFEIDKPQRDISLDSDEKAVDFNFSGSLKSELDLFEKDFNLHIFSNKKTDYKNFLPLFTGKPELDKTGETVFKLDFKTAIVLKPGLYYYLLEDAETEELFFVKKFKVN